MKVIGHLCSPIGRRHDAILPSARADCKSRAPPTGGVASNRPADLGSVTLIGGVVAPDGAGRVRCSERDLPSPTAHDEPLGNVEQRDDGDSGQQPVQGDEDDEVQTDSVPRVTWELRDPARALRDEFPRS